MVYKIVRLINASIQTWQLMRANQEFTQPLSLDPGGPVAAAPLPARKPYGCRSSGVHGRRVLWWSHSCNSTASNSLQHLGVAEENLASGVLNQRTPKQGTLKLANFSTCQYLHISLVIAYLHSCSIGVKSSVANKPTSANLFQCTILTTSASTSELKTMM